MKFKDNGSYDALTKTAVIMRDGVYTYLAGEFPGTLTEDADPETKLRVYRSPESVKAAFKRFKELGKIPVIFEHPDKDLDLKDYSQGYGYDPELIEDGINLAIKCKLKLRDESQEAYEELGIREISCGWSGDFVKSEDTSVYDYEQTFDEFNHIALVPEGRCGTLCSIKDRKGANMKLKARKIKDADHAKLVKKAGKYMDEIAKLAKESEEIEDSHAEGLLTAIKGLKEAISGFEAFASQENKEPMLDEEVEEDEEVVEDEAAAKKELDSTETIEDEDEATDLPEAEVEVKEVNDFSPSEVLAEADEAERKGLKGKDVEKHLLKKFKGRDINDECEDEAVIEDEDVDKRKLISEVDAIAMKPADEFKGGAEEKFRTITKKLEELGYNSSSRGTMNDAKVRVLDSKTKRYLDARIKDAAELGMKLAVKRFHDVLPFIADGTISFADIKPGMTPCDIKQKFVEEKTGKRYNDAKSLNVAFDIATKAQFNDGWKGSETFHADVLDKKADDIDSIGVKRKGAK